MIPAPVFSIPGLTATIADELQKFDPLLNIADGKTDFKVLGCDHSLEFNVTRVLGLSCLRPKISLDFRYSESESGNPIIIASASFSFAAESLQTNVLVKLKRTGSQKKCGLLKRETFPGKVDVQAKIGISASMQADIHIDKMFADMSSAIHPNDLSLSIDCKEIKITTFKLEKFFGEGAIQVAANIAMQTTLKSKLCDKIATQVSPALDKVIKAQMEQAGLMSEESRRLRQQSDAYDSEGQSDQSLRGRNLGTLFMDKYYCDNTDPSDIFRDGIVDSSQPCQPVYFLVLAFFVFLKLA